MDWDPNEIHRQQMKAVRRKAIADVIELIRSERATHPSQQIDMESEELVKMIQALAE